MKTILITLLLFSQFNLFSQTAREFYNSGWDKHNTQDYKGAIDEYTKAIEADETYVLAWYNRGIAYLMLNKQDEAMDDFEEVLEIDENYFMAPYQIATYYAQNEDYAEAEEYYSMVIDINPDFEDAYVMRGQMRYVLDEKDKACEDFVHLQSMNKKKAEDYLLKFCPDQVDKMEIFALDWPDEENWRVADNRSRDGVNTMDLLKGDETFENWTELGNMQSLIGIRNVDLEKGMDLLFIESKKTCENPILTFLEKDLKAEHPWIMFTIDCAEYKNDDNPESQLWFLIQGKTSFYMCFRAMREAKIDEENIARLSKFFKAGKVDYLKKD
jgi:tetratricopeptide (TPR) repeat protein